MVEWQLHPIILTLAVLLVPLRFSDAWQYSWSCVKGRCVRNEDREFNSIGQSQDVCRLNCGQYGSLWPQPTGPTSLGDKVVPFHPEKVEFNYASGAGLPLGEQSSESQKYLARVARRFVADLMEMCVSNCSGMSQNHVIVRITTNSPDLTLNWETDESYMLRVTHKQNKVHVKINATTVYGATHATETLKQLIAKNTVDSNNLVIVASAKISDKPVYGHRGLMLDTSRHFFPVPVIKRTMDGMAMSKLNVFHWHATDSHSFPLDIPSHPEFARYGAFSPEETYSKADMEEIVLYGRERGIRVILEIDAPGHAGNGWQWGPNKGLGNLAVCVNKQPWRDFCLQPPCGQLNPVNPNTYKVLRDLYRDLINIFPKGEMFHMGGDEVAFACWNSTDEIRQWLEKRNRTATKSDYLQLQTEFQNRALKIYDEEMNNAETPIILWSSHLTDPEVITFDRNRYIIEVWNIAQWRVEALIEKGYRVIVANYWPWYLSSGFWTGSTYGDWNTMYDFKLPRSGNVLGGETAMWTEWVDQHNLDSRVWPRAAAVAERLWTNPSTPSTMAETRFFQFRERLIRHGIQADLVTDQWCYLNDQECYYSESEKKIN